MLRDCRHSLGLAAIVAIALTIGCDRSPPVQGVVDDAAESGSAKDGQPPRTKDSRSREQIYKDNEFLEIVRDGKVAAARELLEAGANVNARYINFNSMFGDGSGYTALMYAAIKDNVEMTKLILCYKPDLGQKMRGKTAFYYAAIHGHDEIVQLLKDAGAEGDAAKIRSTRELIRAACKGFEIGPKEGYPLYPGSVRDLEGAQAISEVLKLGANVNDTDAEGFTPLMYAANLGLVANVKELLALGADANLKSEYDETALSMAEKDSSVNREERRQIVEILKEHLAKNR